MFICIIVLAQAYVFNWLIPAYTMLSAATGTAVQNLEMGYWYLLVFAVILVAIGLAIRLMNRTKIQ